MKTKVAQDYFEKIKFAMKKFLFLLLITLFVGTIWAQDSYRNISGIVTDGKRPLKEVEVTNIESESLVKTDASGRYSIRAQEGETLVYNYSGKKAVEINVEDVTTYLNINLKDEIQELSEVVISKKNSKTQAELTQEYNINKDLIRTSYGIIDTKRSNYNIRVFQGKNLNPASYDIISILRAKVPNILVPNNTFASNNVVAYFPRGYTSINNPTPILFDVDGNLMQTVPTYVDVLNIDRIAIITSLGALQRYGSLAAGGLVIINTKVTNFTREPGTVAPYDQAKLRTNFVQDGVAKVATEEVTPVYLESLRSTENLEEAIALYNEMSKRYGPSPYFYLDARNFFIEEREDSNTADQITKIITDKFSENPVVLKALAYQLDEEKNYKNSLELYKKIFVLRPDYQQSYRDLANAYLNYGNAHRAALLYARYNYILSQGLFEESETFSTILKRDFDNLLAQNRELLPKTKFFDVKDKDGFNGTRLFFEWNDSEAEFELQFVNNDKQYYLFKHSYFDNEKLIKEEKQYGFSSQEHLIFDAEDEWQVNVNYLGNKSLTPTYLKVTIYRNFGLASEQKESQVFKLSAKNLNQELTKIKNNYASSKP
ncbi:MAG: carboxypeptidase-like regulatory domain-containing protein [Eudoraea sp.]